MKRLTDEKVRKTAEMTEVVKAYDGDEVKTMLVNLLRQEMVCMAKELLAVRKVVEATACFRMMAKGLPPCEDCDVCTALKGVTDLFD